MNLYLTEEEMMIFLMQEEEHQTKEKVYLVVEVVNLIIGKNDRSVLIILNEVCVREVTPVLLNMVMID